MYKIYKGLLEISKEKKNNVLEYVQKHEHVCAFHRGGSTSVPIIGKDAHTWY